MVNVRLQVGWGVRGEANAACEVVVSLLKAANSAPNAVIKVG